ncbi:hypothetical protein IIA94_00260, partial [Patescibacteria group bacterium]|nr:hypothetical protein [Patescibacteria group bacterium]
MLFRRIGKIKPEVFLRIVFILLLSVAVSFIFSSSISAATGVPEILNHQGRLLDSSDNLLGGSGTDYCFRFSIYDDATVGSGTKLWPTGIPSTMTVEVKNGVFNVGIGDTDAGGDTLDYNFEANDTIYLNVEVAAQSGGSCASVSFETLGPRQRIVSSGYTINASTVGGFTPSQTPTGSQIPVLTSGNFDIAGTLESGSSDVTLTLTTGFIDGDALTLFVGGDGVGVTQASSGLEIQSNGLTLLQGCADNQILKWDETQDDWNCEADLDSGGSTLYDSIGDPVGPSIIVFADTETNTWQVGSDGESFFVISGTDTDLVGSTTFLTIQTIDNDDAEFVPFTIIDDSGGTPDILFNIDYAGAITVGTIDVTQITGATLLLAANNLSDLGATSTAIGNLGLTIGTDVEVDLVNEAGLYAVLSDVTQFWESG